MNECRISEVVGDRSPTKPKYNSALEYSMDTIMNGSLVTLKAQNSVVAKRYNESSSYLEDDGR